jgi:hypothetical protein
MPAGSQSPSTPLTKPIAGGRAKHPLLRVIHVYGTEDGCVDAPLLFLRRVTRRTTLALLAVSYK